MPVEVRNAWENENSEAVPQTPGVCRFQEPEKDRMQKGRTHGPAPLYARRPTKHLFCSYLAGWGLPSTRATVF